MAELSEEVMKLRLTIEQLNTSIETIGVRMEAFDNKLNSTDPLRPGVATRVDRIEQTQIRNDKLVAWVMGGGIITLVGTIATLLKVASLR